MFTTKKDKLALNKGIEGEGKGTRHYAALENLLKRVNACGDSFQLSLDFGPLSVDELNGILNWA